MPARALWLRSGGRRAGWGPPGDLGLLLSRLVSAWRGVHLSFVTARGLHIWHTVGVPHIWSPGPCELGADETEVGTVDTWGHSDGEWGAGIRTGSSAPQFPCGRVSCPLKNRSLGSVSESLQGWTQRQSRGDPRPW